MKSNNTALIWILALIKFIFPFFLQNSFYELHRDEFLYLEQGKHLALGFMEVPPLLGFLAWLTNLMGNSFFLVKFWPSLFGALTFVLTAKIIDTLGGKSLAIFLAFLSFIASAYLRVHYLFQPNFLEIFFYTLIAYSIIRFLQTEKKLFLYVFGIACGLGLLSKYSVAFFIIGIVVGLLVSHPKKIFLNPHFYGAMLLGVLIIIPNVWWQYQHNFPVVHHMKELQETQLQYVHADDFLKDQFIMFLPCCFIWITGLVYLPLSKKGRNYLFVFIAYVVVLTILILMQGKNYYALGLYPVLFAFGAYCLERLTVKRVKFMRLIFITVPFVMGIYFIPVALPVFKPTELAAYYKAKDYNKLGLLKWEDLQNHPLPQDFADMLGWKEITRETAYVYNNLSEEEKSKTIIKCDNYGLCGAMNYYGKKLGLPEIYSTNGSFLFWMPDNYHTANVITVGEKFPDSSRNVFKIFKRISVEGQLKDSLARENGTTIIFWREADTSVLSNFLKEEVAEKKSKFTRK